MAYDIQLNLPAPWQKEMETYEDESGFEISHLEAHLYNPVTKRDDGYIDLYVSSRGLLDRMIKKISAIEGVESVTRSDL